MRRRCCYIGEKVGAGGNPKSDIALEIPLECTNSVALPAAQTALAVVALAPKGCFLHAPDTYMEKIAVGAKGGRRHRPE